MFKAIREDARAKCRFDVVRSRRVLQPLLQPTTSVFRRYPQRNEKDRDLRNQAPGHSITTSLRDSIASSFKRICSSAWPALLASILIAPTEIHLRASDKASASTRPLVIPVRSRLQPGFSTRPWLGASHSSLSLPLPSSSANRYRVVFSARGVRQTVQSSKGQPPFDLIRLSVC